MKRNILILTATVTASLIMGGCATIISGKTQAVNITSKKKRSFSIDGRKYTTPAKVVLTRGKNNKIIKVRGCRNVILKSSVNPVVYGNVVAGGVIGSSVDSGEAAWKYQDNIELCK